MRSRVERFVHWLLDVPATDEVEARRERTLLALLVFLTVTSVMLAAIDAIRGETGYALISGISGLGLVGLVVATRRGRRWPRYALVLLMSVGIAIGFKEAVDTPAILAFALPIVMIPFIAAPWLAVPMTLVQLAVLYALGWDLSLVLIFIFTTLAMAMWLIGEGMEWTIYTLQRVVAALQEANAELEREKALLKERTRVLDRQAAYLRAAAVVTREVVAEVEAARLPRRAVRLLVEQFPLERVSLLLVDEAGGWGTRYVVSAGKDEVQVERVPPDVGRAEMRRAFHSRKEDAPSLSSALSLPLRVRGKMLGVLRVELPVSAEEGGFDAQSRHIFQVLAEQIAAAVDNTRLIAEAREAVEAQRRAQGELDRSMWRRLFQEQRMLGYRSTSRGVVAASESWRPEMVRALREGQAIQGAEPDVEGRLPVAVPIRTSAGQVIGVINTYRPAGSRPWTQEELTLLEALSEQLGVALESARFYRDSQRRAVREQLVAETTRRMREPLELEEVLRVAADEMRTALGLEELVVHLTTVEGQG